MELANPGIFRGLYQTARLAASYPFDTEEETYLTHITTGTHVAQICPVFIGGITPNPRRTVTNCSTQNQRLSMEDGNVRQLMKS